MSFLDYEALLTCRNRCAAGGYVALTLDDFNSTVGVDRLNVTYYLLVGGESVSAAHVVNSSGDVVAQVEVRHDEHRANLFNCRFFFDYSSRRPDKESSNCL